MIKSWVFSRNAVVVLIYRIIIVLFLFSLCRIGFYIFNLKMFPGINAGEFLSIMRGGLVFDISATVYTNLLFILLQIVPFDFRYNGTYQKVSKYLFFITNGLALAINCADFVYYRFVLKRAAFDIFKTFRNESNLPKLILKFMLDYWPVTLFGILLLIMMVYLYNRVKLVKPEPSNKVIYYSVNFLAIPLFAAFVIGGARGGLNDSIRPITISNAARYVNNPRNVAIVLNTPFSLMRTSGKKVLEKYSFFDEEKLKELYNPHHIPAGDKPFSADNVVVIILESFSREYIGSLNRDLDGGTYQGYTPFLDSLISESLTFDVSLANGKKSIDAMPSVLASIPSLETPYVISHYANNEINGLASVLKKKGYHTAFYHGGPARSMGFDSFARMSGFDSYVGYEQYPRNKEDVDGMWGIWDEPFLKFFGKALDSIPEPFLAAVFTLSSHHPFIVPDKYKNTFKKGPVPIVEVIGYSDYALRQFFREVSRSSWFKNTLFVLTADHTNESIHKEFQNNFGSFCIPVILYKPGSTLKGMKSRIAQQIDIMPTILSFLNFDEEYIAFGNNLLDDSYESFAFNTNGSNYHLYMKDHILEMVDNKSVGLYNFKTDRFLEKNLLDSETELAVQMEEKLKAIIQTYNSRLIDNNMIVRKSDNNVVR
ncbi:MAG TPA: sulfatase-like hydrolase/transferase [Bacteroidales bacterium]|nr:sulfatase-like hydrolase/transferase [Bacteroidales bacterium]OQB64024.1 MAG: Lipoteichoic acid synthase 1 [Bacteroidetes bacterium ADurb.Bin145]HQG63656.1 sulfatase-like hydrolase/transferase [Bacteroidales bacterium]HQK68238.1 sulfatase-like hydrolase/transferase [Bacteroidales bacterium]